MARSRQRARAGLLGVAAMALLLSGTADGHIYIFEFQRSGAAPCTPGTGWTVEFFYGIPDENAANLLTAENYVSKLTPTFTFQADYLDWPAGADAYRPDAAFATLGDLLDGHIHDLSDPGALDLPFATFLLRARGHLNAQFETSDFPVFEPEVWQCFGMVTQDGGRVRIGSTTVFRTTVPSDFVGDNAIHQLPGTYPIEVTFFQRNDPAGAVGMPNAGFEFYTCSETGPTTPGSANMPCNQGSGTLAIPERIHPDADIGPPFAGDFDADDDFDLRDFAYLQRCFTGPEFEGSLSITCEQFDLNGDEDVDGDDWNLMLPNFLGPDWCLSLP